MLTDEQIEGLSREECNDLRRRLRLRVERIVGADPCVYVVRRSRKDAYGETQVNYLVCYNGQYVWFARDLTYSGGVTAPHVAGFGSLFYATSRNWAAEYLAFARGRDGKFADECEYEVVAVDKVTGEEFVKQEAAQQGE